MSRRWWHFWRRGVPDDSHNQGGVRATAKESAVERRLSRQERDAEERAQQKKILQHKVQIQLKRLHH